MAEFGWKNQILCKIACLWLKSLRISISTPNEFCPGIICLWHRDLAASTAAFRGIRLTALVSKSSDGSLFSQIASALGYHVARGSDASGQSAIRALVMELKIGHFCAMALDGPKGPAGIEKPGARWLSEISGKYRWEVLCRYSCAFTLNSWDRARIPLPFSKVAVRIRRML